MGAKVYNTALPKNLEKNLVEEIYKSNDLVQVTGG